MDLALNNQQRLICHKTQQTKPNHLQRGNPPPHPTSVLVMELTFPMVRLQS